MAGRHCRIQVSCYSSGVNIIIVRRAEVGEDGRAVLSGRRAAHIVDVLGAKVGHSLRVGAINGASGSGTVEAIGPERVTLACSFTDEPVAGRAIDLLLALPRPKVMKRLWAPLASLGVRRVVLTNAAKVERNYFDTHWIKEEYFEPLLIEGLEQGGSTALPSVSVVRRLKPFVEDELDQEFRDSTRLLAHPGGEVWDGGGAGGAESALLAIGPEAGWTEYELGLLEERGFSRMSLGNRTLRSDVACIAAISVVRHAMGQPYPHSEADGVG